MPDWTPVVRTAFRSRVPVYWTLMPVESSNGLTIARNESCSDPPHVPMTVTEPPTWPPLPAGEAPGLPPPPPVLALGLAPPPQAPTMMAALASSTAALLKPRLKLTACSSLPRTGSCPVRVPSGSLASSCLGHGPPV